ncbi:MAG: class I SAM-dependent methyltransferase [Chloroflexi bacterium]|nr:class I SAM-dependent methyltransferase [Chloroflexota bacterium]
MDKPMPNLAFNVMSYIFKLRDLLRPREGILKEVGIQPGFRVLDYGCGPGGYVAGAAELVGESGKVYALDLHPLAIRRVQDLARKKQLANVETILSDCKTGLPDGSIDAVLLYDIFHMLSDPQAILAELHRVLKPDGILSLLNPHMSEDEIIRGVTSGRLFRLSRKEERTYRFEPVASHRLAT